MCVRERSESLIDLRSSPRASSLGVFRIGGNMAHVLCVCVCVCVCACVFVFVSPSRGAEWLCVYVTPFVCVLEGEETDRDSDREGRDRET